MKQDPTCHSFIGLHTKMLHGVVMKWDAPNEVSVRFQHVEFKQNALDVVSFSFQCIENGVHYLFHLDESGLSQFLRANRTPH